MENQQNLIWIYSRKMSIYLQLRGHILVGVKNDIKQHNKKIYFFVNTPRLKESMKKFNSDFEFQKYFDKLVSEGEDEIDKKQTANTK